MFSCLKIKLLIFAFMNIVILTHLKYYNVAALVVDKICDDKHIRSAENRWMEEYEIILSVQQTTQ